MVKIITRYDYEAQASVAPGVDFDPKKKADRSLTNQADLVSCDINKIMARYEQTGVLVDPMGTERKPVYGDFSEVPDYHASLCAIRNVDRAFSVLPVSVRNRFENDPAKLIAFLDDPQNIDEAVKLGLRSAVVAEAAPAAAAGASGADPAKPVVSGDAMK